MAYSKHIACVLSRHRAVGSRQSITQATSCSNACLHPLPSPARSKPALIRSSRPRLSAAKK